MAARKRLMAALLMTVCCFGPQAAARTDENDIERWRQRMLRALEDSTSRKPERAQGEDDKRQSLAGPRADDPRASAAAAEARRRYGGRPLAVVPYRDGYRVRLLLEDGRVTTVEIED